MALAAFETYTYSCDGTVLAGFDTYTYSYDGMAFEVYSLALWRDGVGALK